tara:strand:+ start:5174 stop:5452 length:279 start_codon:yes stop_codon:yes gene_type:complete
MADKVIPIGNKVLVKQIQAKETYGDTNIYIPDAAQTKELKAYVVSVGDDVEGIEEGDLIQYGEYAQPVNMSHEGEQHLLINKQDILAIIVSV